MNAYCINLDERPEKWEQAKREASKLGITPDRISGIRLTPGWKGCRATHLSLLNGIEDDVFMIIEDDIKVHCDNPRTTLDKAIEQLPNDWDLLYLGSTLNTPLQRYSKNLYRLKKGWTTHAIIYNNQNGVVDYILDHKDEIGKIDVFYANKVQWDFNCFITYPLILTQREGFSDVVNKHVDYKVIDMRYKKYTRGYWCENCYDATKEGCEECKEDAWWLYV